MNIQNLINPLLLLEIKEDMLVLSEAENKEKVTPTLQEVIITSLPKGLIAYSTDIYVKDLGDKKRKLYNEYMNVPSPLLTKPDGKNWVWTNGSEFVKTKYIDKRSDAVLVWRNESEVTIVICDLKSTKFSPKECAYKFMVDKLFLDYLISVLNTIFREQLTISSVQYVIFYLKQGKQGLNNKQKPRTTKEHLQVFEKVKMTDFDEDMFKYPFFKPHKNEIKWEKLIGE
jgi:hypothetical protein